jgi:hypothetical protein
VDIAEEVVLAEAADLAEEEAIRAETKAQAAEATTVTEAVTVDTAAAMVIKADLEESPDLTIVLERAAEITRKAAADPKITAVTSALTMMTTID